MAPDQTDISVANAIFAVVANQRQAGIKPITMDGKQVLEELKTYSGFYGEIDLRTMVSVLFYFQTRGCLTIDEDTVGYDGTMLISDINEDCIMRALWN
ncbi:MAG: hypothetical protein M3437_08340 [Chloroflexota bacterium]|nr:hypothetical protein [Chloroflexota bacterium]MDQ5867181.1 hypothetical protein [Chloroflexota bacterium]